MTDKAAVEIVEGAISRIIADLGGSPTLSSCYTRAVNMWRQSSLSAPAFVRLCGDAAMLTIEASDRRLIAARVPYMFAVLTNTIDALTHPPASPSERRHRRPTIDIVEQSTPHTGAVELSEPVVELHGDTLVEDTPSGQTGHAEVDAVLTYAREGITKANFDAWLAPLRLVACDEAARVVTLEARDAWAARWIETKIRPHLDRAINAAAPWLTIVIVPPRRDGVVVDAPRDVE